MKNVNRINRDYALDIARAIAIILVVTGHYIQYNFRNFDNIYIYKMIYSFHMPLFMFISGYVSYKSLISKPLYADIKTKTLLLLYPFLLWGFISHVINTDNNFLQILHDIIFYPSYYGFWFLWVLFWIYVFTKIFFYLDSKLLKGGGMS